MLFNEECVAFVMQGILDVYYYTLTKVELHGPTNFSMFLDKAIEMASKPIDQNNQRYFLLLVITVSLVTSDFRK